MRDMFDLSESDISDDELQYRMEAPTPRKYKDYYMGGEWWTAEQAAEFFNISVREINERYRPEMPTGTVLEPVTEHEYGYDFESPDVDFSNYQPQGRSSTSPFRRGYSVDVEAPHAPLDTGSLTVFSTINERGFDFGLEPVSRRKVRKTERLFLVEALLDLRFEKVNSRKAKPLPPRGEGGKFTKAS